MCTRSADQEAHGMRVAKWMPGQEQYASLLSCVMERACQG